MASTPSQNVNTVPHASDAVVGFDQILVSGQNAPMIIGGQLTTSTAVSAYGGLQMVCIRLITIFELSCSMLAS